MTRFELTLYLLHSLEGLVDDTPGRGDVDCYEHSVQMATRARRDKCPELGVFAALIHDVCRVLTPTNHGLAVSILYGDVLGPLWGPVVAHHSDYQHSLLTAKALPARYTRTAWHAYADAFAAWDAVSFDPGYRSDRKETFHDLLFDILE